MMLPSLVHEPQRVAAEDSRQRRIFRPLICRKCAGRAPNQRRRAVAAGLGGVADAARSALAGRASHSVSPSRGASASPESAAAAVAAHADDDAPAQIRQLAAGLPARVRHGQLPLAGVPFAQLVQDPAGFLAHRVVDLAQRDPVGRGDAQAVVGDDEADAAAARTQQHEADGLFVGVHLAPAAPGGSGSGQGVGTRAEAFGDSVSSGSPEWAGTDPADAPGTARQARARSGRRARRGVRRRHAFRRAGFPRVEQEFELSAARHTFQG